MKQLLQHLRTGELEIADVPCPAVSRGHVLVQNRSSLISAGTERMLVEFSKASLLSKARQQPEKVKQVLDSIKTNGILPTLEQVFARLDEPLPLGYCSAGVVVEVGAGVTQLKVGDRVACNGNHAEMVQAPVNLCARIPDNVQDDHAAFTVLSSIALQGIRLINPSLGESVAVFGLGLIGLVAVQLLRASGCRVIGIDMNRGRLDLARQFGVDVVDLSQGADPVASCLAFSEGRGIDGVLITASAKTNDIVKQSARMSRKRGRIVLVGVVGLELDRADFYEKELTFQVSCSYGPGRYDPQYEQQGIDYPFGFVRWTEQRNMEAILNSMSSGALQIEPLITTRFPHAEAVKAYQALTGDSSAIGIVMQYPNVAPPKDRVIEHLGSGFRVQGSTKTRTGGAQSKAVVGVIGAGQFTKLFLMPGLSRTRAELAGIASAKGVTAAVLARKYGFFRSTTDYRTLLDDSRINAVLITTRHDMHPGMVVEALQAGKHVYVEKPVAIDRAGLLRVQEALDAAPSRVFMVGFNRRYSPHIQKMKALLNGRTGPLCMTFVVNAGAIPMTHWAQDPQVGGGRIIGEGCHWIDVFRFLAGGPIYGVQATQVGDTPGLDTPTDKVSITFRFTDGSIGTLHYFANGHKSYVKEKMEVFCDGKILMLDNFRKMSGSGFKNFKKMNLFRRDKGHRATVAHFIDVVENGGQPSQTRDEIINVSNATFAAVESAAGSQVINL